MQLTGEMLTLIGGLLVAYFVYVLIARKNDKPSTDSPAMAHAALREIVERAVEEARKLPALNASEDGEQSREGRAIADHSYEDLLATAILNKVIERLQRERVDGNSNVLHITDASKTKYISTENEHGIEDDAESYECNGDRGASIRQNGDHRESVSFMMEEQIEEVTTITSDDEPADNDALEYGCTRRVPFPEFGMDIVDPPRELSSSLSDSSDSDHNENSRIRTKYRATDHTTDLVSPIESWEDNWLFQKKRNARSQPDAVAMLVPSSNTCYKALIGDRDAEDTSDLSECSSTKSDEEIEKELMEAINNVIPRSRRTSECDAEDDQQVRNDIARLGEDEVDQVCQAKAKIEEIVAEKVVEDENDKKRPSESSPALITGTEGEESETKERPPMDIVERSERTIASVMESPMQKDVKVLSEKLSERSDRGNIADEDEEQQESEYTEHYDTAVQRHLDSLTKVDVYSGESEAVAETREFAEEQPENISTEEERSERSEATIQLTYYATKESYVDTITEKDLLSAPPRPGTIAEREHKKWENAPPIENNPYSEENIRKRSWERRYSRKSADLTGVQYEMKLNEVNLDTLLTPDPPDIKRFGRDYYINQSKVSSGERSERAKSAMSSSSRPSSSLSQRSSCAGDEQREQQDEVMSGEIEDVSVPREEKDTKVTSTWRRNNAEMISFETNNRAANSRAPGDGTGQERRADDILEDEQRKNSKNEINAKLNNQEHSLEAERRDDEKKRIVRRIDLKAYGFENEFSVQRNARPQQQRVVNRLDLRSFGYQDGLRRTHSNNQLDQPADNEKSNLTRCAIGREKHRAEYKGFPIDRRDLTKSSGELNQLHEDVEKVGSLVSAKSMPNVADDAYYYANPVRVNNNDDNIDDDDVNHDEEEDEMAARNSRNRVSDELDERNAANMDDGSLNGYDEASSDLDRSFEDIYIEDKNRLHRTDEKLPMPSVKRLAEAFSGRQTSVIEPVPAKASKTLVTKLDDVKDRSFTPEVQIVETPKQMHSLTARSLSREFREGLRQMPSKITSPPVSRSLIEERPANRSEVVRSKREDSDVAVISPGKLKSNIIFWEQMQKRN
ncbi:PREDICTED: uncharacterized protein LOC106743619 isoform X2 [Dinoponera quadriceps]|uniref:Uncharacterized protein LOC106743619 isoform X2 n=1 Tax=Dinoponera quadriceps TaxID=609295 RepID=A0A6P3X430_DINQU|nr:PREDICTED: uncharacterized protein LOC106743619 isoform X2 [Dinoponera quadriceps]XP_014473116.1 PREDICTED: uncharacterized protein LOC106743619 isoform X2 [Dinoponera quadriceps]XP_014473117.1 PREDICTED: uncharacterized protein LOC106743619 isoform X2 [Dinoponera quadriceps]XP_014473118.1 PREDICTED: uncharacterized protein LOC106743619 isoform X2 [Dinoponera quadriceps]XP_014473120.1 PREDICTED: uncharacterized protein LOC106743619 isoform X2 [Dinoponera quadriceps]XP_014473121.1 PREDICTED: